MSLYRDTGIVLRVHKLGEADRIITLLTRQRGIVRAEFIDVLVGQHLKEHAGYHGTMVWVLMMMEQWFKQRDIKPA